MTSSPEAFARALEKTGIHLDFAFQNAVAWMLPHEGVEWDDAGTITKTGAVDDPRDSGGATNFGISLKLARELGYLDVNHDGVIDARDIAGLHLADAITVIQLEFWRPQRYAELPPFAGRKLLDLAFNMGPTFANKIGQRACRAAASTLGAIADDGAIGAATIAAFNALPAASMIAAMRSEAAGHYRELVACHPQSSVYLTGWLNRAYA